MDSKARDSIQVQKARQKIKKQIEAADKQFNAEALKKMSLLIQRQLARHKPERISLKHKSITLFDENQHSAKTESKFVQRLLHEIERKTKPKGKGLGGRIAHLE